MSLSSSIASSMRSGLLEGNDRLVVLPRWRLVKASGVNGAYDAQAYTPAMFTATVSVEFTIDSIGPEIAVGLSADNPDANYTGIDFAIIVGNTGQVYRVENGSLTAMDTTVAGDVWKVTRTMPGGAVTYYKNGTLKATSSSTTTATLLVDSSLSHTGATAANLAVIAASGHQPVTWTTTGVAVT